MKKIILFLIILCAGITYGQGKGDEVFKLKNYVRKDIIIKNEQSRGFSTANFSSVVVKDLRPDTSAIGFHLVNYYAISNLPSVIEGYIKNSIAVTKPVDTNRQLIIFLKKIWITHQMREQDKNWTGGIICSIECFYKNSDSYFPLFRFDTAISSSLSNFSRDAPMLVNSCFEQILQKIMLANTSDFRINQRQLSFAEVENYHQKDYGAAILTDTTLKKGVYKTFPDFKNNNPTDESFEVVKNKFTDALYVKDANGNDELKRNIWGYCDGNNIFIKSADKFFQLVKCQNTFYTNGAKSITKNIYADVWRENLLEMTKHATEDSPKKKVSYTLAYRPFQLDMETGELF